MNKKLILLFISTACLCADCLYAQEASKKFRDTEKNISISLPKSWNYRIIQNGQNTVMKITKTYLMDENSPFNTGVSISRNKNAVLSFQKGPKLLIEHTRKQWYDENASDSTFAEFAKGQYSAGNFQGTIVEVLYQQDKDKPVLRMFVVWLADETDLIEVRMIGLAEEWARIKPIYLEALSSLEVKR
jgi:hypothetical protein